VGSWIVHENNQQNMIHLKSHGVIYKSSTAKSDYVGYWEVNDDYFYFNLRDHGIEKKYYGKVINNTLNIEGNVCEGLTSPFYINHFTMTPAFEQFHNISFVNDTNTDKYTYLEQNSVTGKWVLENIHTNNVFLLELFSNNTWHRTDLNSTISNLSGKWNLFNETGEINTNCAIKYSGKNIWLSINKEDNQSYITYDMIFMGKIVQLGSIKYADKEKQLFISSKINGSVIYGFDMEPEISETFYMKRWFSS